MDSPEHDGPEDPQVSITDGFFSVGLLMGADGPLARRGFPGLGPGFVPAHYLCRPTHRSRGPAAYPLPLIRNYEGLSVSTEKQGSWGESQTKGRPCASSADRPEHRCALRKRPGLGACGTLYLPEKPVPQYPADATCSSSNVTN